MNWIHRLFNPHCIECEKCESCETLREQLNIANADRKKLLEVILENHKPVVNIVEPEREQPEPIIRAQTWNIRRQHLEDEARNKAKIMKQKSTEEIEKELGVDNAMGPSNAQIQEGEIKVG